MDIIINYIEYEKQKVDVSENIIIQYNATVQSILKLLKYATGTTVPTS